MLTPLRKYRDNFRVLSTDYENYAILYQCTPRTALYNKDIITILVRDPDLSRLQSGTEDTIRREFQRLFGQPPKDENGDTLAVLTEAEEERQVGKGKDLGRERTLSIGPGLPLEFDSHLKRLTHDQCTKSEYPDLSLSMTERAKLKEERQRAQRQRDLRND